MALADKLRTIKTNLSSLITYANRVTGQSDASIGECVRTLADGYGQGGSDIITGTITPVGNTYLRNPLLISEGDYEATGIFETVDQKACKCAVIYAETNFSWLYLGSASPVCAIAQYDKADGTNCVNIATGSSRSFSGSTNHFYVTAGGTRVINYGFYVKDGNIYLSDYTSDHFLNAGVTYRYYIIP